MKIFLKIFTVLLCSTLMMGPALARQGTQRTDRPSVLEPHLKARVELRNYIPQMGVTRAYSWNSCTIDGGIVDKSPYHCRDYAGTNNTHYRIVFNDGNGSGSTQRIYEIIRVEKRYELVLKVKFENTVVVYDEMSGRSVAGTPAPTVTGGGRGTDPVGEFNRGVAGAIQKAIPGGVPAGLGAIFR